MTMAAMDTRFADEFRKVIGSESNSYLAELRKEGFAYFTKVGFPTQHNERVRHSVGNHAFDGDFDHGPESEC